ncbi:MAG: phospho-N-acetylmuramoyl-pentapeptide-transferase [Candidatus Eremiobacteraeota bacterium]|nr:phospho-N-acetylmuramoyl-pentapeptide-transferase [Candidatus Eremiobacteraeota bacterium]
MSITELVVLTLLSFAVVALAGKPLIGILSQLQFKQHAYEDAPISHQVKSGTPTMGGLLFMLVIAIWLAVNRNHDTLIYALGFLVLACGAVGWLDDFLSIARGKNLGLRARTKFLATALIGIMFLRWINDSTVIFPRDVIFAMGSYQMVVPHWAWLIVGLIAITGTIHAVNLTDGLDGLATGTIIPPLIVLSAISVQMRMPAVTSVLLCGIGAALGFLLYNRYPAKLFMGDTGSLALGALLSGAAILTGEMLLLILIGGVFVAEAVSVIVQVAYFKRTRRRIFRMSPLHHHFELGGWPETLVTTRFWIASFMLSAVGWVLVR